MNDHQIAIARQCAVGATEGTLNFPQILELLRSIDVERYHADYSRQEITYYLTTGASLVVPVPHEDHPTAMAFDATAVEQSVRQSQRGEHTYLDFVRKTMAAGCVGYFVLITGFRVSYFGRGGECHTELIPH